MRWIKFTLLISGGLVVLGLIVIVIVLTTFDNDDYRRLMTWSVKHFTGYSMTVEGPFELELSAQPSLSVEAIRIDPGPDGVLPPVSQTGKIKFRIELWRLIIGTLVIKNCIVEDVAGAVIIEKEAETEGHGDPERKVPPNIEIPIVESVRIRNIHLVVIDKAEDRTVSIRLDRFHIDDIRNSGPLFVNGVGSVNGNEFKLDGQLGALSAIMKGTQPYPVHLNMSATGFRVSAAGTFDDFLDGEGVKLHLSGEADELSLLFGLLQIKVPPLGRLKLEANVTQDLTAPGLSDLSLSLSGDSRVELAVEGSVENLLSGTGTNIRFSASCANPDIFKLLISEDLPQVQRIRTTGEVIDKEGGLSVENLTVNAAIENGLVLAVNGRLGLDVTIGVPEITQTALDIALSIPATEPFKSYLFDFLSTNEMLNMDQIKALPEFGPIRARARLAGPFERQSLEDIEVEAGGAGPLRMISQGRIGRLFGKGDLTASDIDLTASIESETTDLLTTGFGLQIPNLGSLSFNTRIRGSLNQFQLGQIDARTVHVNGLTVLVSGKTDIKHDKNAEYIGKMALEVRMSAPNTHAALAPMGVADLPDLKSVQLKVRVGGTTRNLSLKKVDLNIGRPGSTRLQLKGDVGQIPLTGDRPISDVKLKASFSAGSTGALTPVLGFTVPDFGALQATGRIFDRNGIFGMHDVNVAIGNQKKPAVKLIGSIASVAKGRDLALEGIDITAAISDLGLKPLSGLIGRPLPDPGPLNGSFRISGSQTKLAVSRISLSTKSSQGMTATASGDIKRISLEGEPNFTGVTASLSLQAPNLGAVPGLDDFNLPELGPFQLKAEINDRKGSLDVETFDIRGGKGKNAFVHIQGKILGINDFKRMRLQASGQTASQIWVAKYLNRPQAENFPLVGAVTISGTDEGMRINELRFGTADEKLLVLKARGKLRRLSTSPEVDLQLAAFAPEPSAIESIVDISLPPLGPLNINGRLLGGLHNGNFRGKTRIGETTFESDINVAVAAPRPRINAKFSTPTVNLVNLGIYPETLPGTSAAASQAKAQKGDRLFDDTPLPLERLKTVDLYFALDADKLVARHITINNLDLDIRLENGRLRIHPARLTYATGFMDVEAIVDAPGSTPEFFLKVTGEDIDIDDLLAHLHSPMILGGALTLVADLQSTGRSVREVAANLNGEFSFALEKGRIRQIVDLLSADLYDLVFSAADRVKYTDLQCLANKIKFEEGVGNIEIFFMDTPRSRVGAIGHINLARESIDVVINPEKKRRYFNKGSAVQINGSLAKPKISTLPANEAARLLMPHVYIPARAFGSLVSLVQNDNDETVCVFK